jgi:hypothetical protein
MWEDIYEKLREWLATQQGFVNPITAVPSLERQPGSLPLEGQVLENIQPILAEQAREAYGVTADVDQASILAEKQAEMGGRSGLGSESYVPKITEEEDDDDLLNKLFLMSMMENLQGGDIGQAPAVVAGGGRREFPTMMRQFAPWEREKPYWWMR